MANKDANTTAPQANTQAAPTTAPENNATKATQGRCVEKKRVFVPRLVNSKKQPNLEGSVNGKAFSLPRGKEHEVPPEVYEVVTRSLANEQLAEDYYNSVNDVLLKKAEDEAANLK